MMMQKISVQGRNGPIELIVQVVDRDTRDVRGGRDVIDVAPAVLHATGDGQQFSNTDSTPALDFVRTHPVTSGISLGKYLVGKKLGEGTFGVVFAARDTQLDRDAAIKVLLPEHVANHEVRRRFIEEGRATARIDHPAIVTVYDCGVEAGCAYLAMELLRGESLTSRLSRSGRLSPEVAMEVGRQLASALAAAHDAGVIHRDLKPDNIFLVPDPAMASGERVKILDFGLAKLGRNDGRTSAKLVFGTPRYMSPEQTRSSATVDARSDIYALGCILFELVCGVPPFDGEVVDVVRAHQQRKAPRVTSIVRALPAALEQLIAHMLEKRADDRPQTMGAVLRALQAGGARPVSVAETLAPTFAEQVRAALPAALAPALAPKPSAVSNPVEWPRIARGTPSPLPVVRETPAGSQAEMKLFPPPRRPSDLAETMPHPIFAAGELAEIPQLPRPTQELQAKPPRPRPPARFETHLTRRRRGIAAPVVVATLLATIIAMLVVWS